MFQSLSYLLSKDLSVGIGLKPCAQACSIFETDCKIGRAHV